MPQATWITEVMARPPSRGPPNLLPACLLCPSQSCQEQLNIALPGDLGNGIIQGLWVLISLEAMAPSPCYPPPHARLGLLTLGLMPIEEQEECEDESLSQHPQRAEWSAGSSPTRRSARAQAQQQPASWRLTRSRTASLFVRPQFPQLKAVLSS